MKRILIITQNYYPEIGSAANRMTNIVSELRLSGHHVTVLTTDPSYPNRNMYKDSKYWNKKNGNHEVIRVGIRARRYTHNIFNRLLLYAEMNYKFQRELKRLKPVGYDFVLATTPAIFVGLAGIAAKKKLKCPFILDIRDIWSDSIKGIGLSAVKPFASIAYLIEKKMYRDSDHIIVNSEGFVPDLLDRGVSKDKVSFMPNSLSDSEFLPQSDEVADDNSFTVVYSGNIGLAQDLDILLDIAQHLQMNSDIKFKIIGYGYRCEELKKKIEDLKLDNVQILKAASKVETMKIIKAAHVAFVSLTDNKVFEKVLPGKIIDYMSAGKPIIGSVGGYAANTIKAAECGFVADKSSSDELVNYILQLKSNSNLRLQLGNNGLRYAEKNFKWSRNIQVLTEVLEKKYEQESMHVRLEPLYK